MSNMTPGEFQHLSANLLDLNRILTQLKDKTNSTSTTSTVSVNAGGMGVWLATTACLIMLGVVIVGALWASREFQRTDAQIAELRGQLGTTQSYLNAIYVQAPQLRPKDETRKGIE